MKWALIMVGAILVAAYSASTSAQSVKLELLGTSAKATVPTAPEGVSWVRNLAVTSRHAYVVAPREGIRIYDVATPSTPKLVSVIPYDADPMWFEPLGNVGILRASSPLTRK